MLNLFSVFCSIFILISSDGECCGVGRGQGVMGGGTQPGKGNIKNRSLSFFFFFLQVLKQMTRNVTGFVFILEIKMTIRWRVEECGGVGDGGGVLDE